MTPARKGVPLADHAEQRRGSDECAPGAPDVPTGPGRDLTVHLDTAVADGLARHAAAAGLAPGELAGRWLVERLGVEEALTRARGGGADQLRRLRDAISEGGEPDEGK